MDGDLHGDEQTGCARAVALLRGRRLAVLTGAGISTESGIPDYRGAQTQRRARNPVQFSTYLADERSRRAYWARSVVGFPRVHRARPNAAHVALADLEQANAVTGVITQNVDRLHHRAGSQRVIELHGALAEVVCLECGTRTSRHKLQQRLLALNPAWDRHRADDAPDGDADLADRAVDSFVVADCELCGGNLKPDVVFFGECVAKSVVAAAFDVVDGAGALVVIGTSLEVYSGLRFVRRAQKNRTPIVIINLGPTRGDGLSTLRINGRAGDLVPALARGLVH